ncbi:tRNA (guanosine(37)-N1)-methyltransferase TrmD [Candidatus Roizmanbacteria bacterium]|nr:tRNA (guanosine(37)-N1)-methyltransferase TrmD [Candidatus Roizmanbacteria bacterium]
MKISIITLFPNMIKGFFKESIIKRAQEKKLVDIELINLRDFAIDDYGTVDDRPYGGGAGMILRIEPLYKAVQFAISNFKFLISKQISNVKKPISKTIITSPKGKVLDQKKAQGYSKLDHLIIIAGHYEGVDERVLNYIDEEVSLGDFIMTGGEITSAAIADAIVRLIPGVLKKVEAIKNETFNIDGKKLLEYPQYTRPEIFDNKKVPSILLSGDHKKIKNWQIKKAYEETLKKRQDLLDPSRTLTSSRGLHPRLRGASLRGKLKYD